MRRAAAAAAVGNIVEWYDWSVYAIFAFYLSAQFFPAGDPTAALISTFAVFAVGFLVGAPLAWAPAAWPAPFSPTSEITVRRKKSAETRVKKPKAPTAGMPSGLRFLPPARLPAGARGYGSSTR